VALPTGFLKQFKLLALLEVRQLQFKKTHARDSGVGIKPPPALNITIIEYDLTIHVQQVQGSTHCAPRAGSKNLHKLQDIPAADELK
jgi:hypothetical protein